LIPILIRQGSRRSNAWRAPSWPMRRGLARLAAHCGTRMLSVGSREAHSNGVRPQPSVGSGAAAVALLAVDAAAANRLVRPTGIRARRLLPRALGPKCLLPNATKGPTGLA
jgi:hypothetical protein